MEKKWAFVYRDFVTGGLETTVMRLCNYLMLENCSPSIIAHSISDKVYLQLKNKKINIILIENWEKNNIFSVLKEKHDIIVVFGMSLYYLLRMTLTNAKVFLYCVHPDHLIRKKFLKRFFYKTLIKYGSIKGEIRYMDISTLERVESYYNISINKSRVLALPFETVENTDCSSEIEELQKKVENELNSKNFHKPLILTICRADFPFKSYVLGLIDAVIGFNRQGYDVGLVIISYGKDITVIREKIVGLSFIKLYGETDYDVLKVFYFSADIYVGMGSTLIEAAKYGVPSIIANVNSPKFTSCGYFWENPQCKGIFDKVSFSGAMLLEQLLNKKACELISLGEKSREIFENNYSISTFCDRLLSGYNPASNRIKEHLIRFILYPLGKFVKP